MPGLGALSSISLTKAVVCMQELKLVQDLIDEGQGHLFVSWPAPGIRALLMQSKTNHYSVLQAHFVGVLYIK